MKSVQTLLSLLLSISLWAGNLDFTHTDSLMGEPSRYEELLSTLEGMLPLSKSNIDRAKVLSRLSCACLLCGEKASSAESKKSYFKKGIDFAQQAKTLDPKNPDAFMWHSANVGRNCQLAAIPQQIAAVPVMTEDLETILEKLGRTDYSAAWQALAEIYINHPFRSNDSAVNFFRMAILTIPSGELRLSSYIGYAKCLCKRGMSVKKREELLNQAFAKDSFKTNIDRCAARGGAQSPSWGTPWSESLSVSSLSDKQEAMMVLEYAQKKYDGWKSKSSLDRKEYSELEKNLKELSR